MCLNKGPTLTVIQSENRRIFGGYTSKNWTKKEGNYSYWGEPDEKAWIFSFDHQSKLKVKQDKKGNAIANQYNVLNIFGSGNDILIWENAHNRSDNWSNLGGSYELPAGILYGSE